MEFAGIRRDTTAVDDSEGRFHYMQNPSMKKDKACLRRNGMTSTDVPKQSGPVLNMAQTLSDQYGLVMNVGATLIGVSHPSANSTDVKSYENGNGGTVIQIGNVLMNVAAPINQTFYKYVKLSFYFVCDPHSMSYMDDWSNYFIMAVSEKRLDSGAIGALSLGLFDHALGGGSHYFTGKVNESISGLSVVTSPLTINKQLYTASATINFLGPITGSVAGGALGGTFTKATQNGITIGNASWNLVDNKYGISGPSPPPPYPWNNNFQHMNMTVEGQ